MLFGFGEGFEEEKICGPRAVTRLRLGTFDTQAEWGQGHSAVQGLVSLARGGIAAALGHFADLLKHNGIEIRRVRSDFRRQQEGG